MAAQLGVPDAASYAQISRESGLVEASNPGASNPTLFVRALYLSLEQQSKKSMGWIKSRDRGKQYMQLFLKQIRDHICDGRKLKGIAALMPHAVCTTIAVELSPQIPAMPQAMLMPLIAGLLFMSFNSLKASFCQMTDAEFVAELEKSQGR